MNLLFAGLGAATLVKLLADHDDTKAAAGPYRDMIVDASKQYGVSPSILAALLWQESRFNPNATGPTADVGIAQFTQVAVDDLIENGRLSPDTTLQDMFDPAIAIPAAAALLDLNRKRSGSLWTSIRAYNVGIGAARSNPSAGLNYLLNILSVAAPDVVLTNWENSTI